jgi:XRE family transcriptional regulator, aerobic/anaerobic benzoate catabolism transcriptional regulator
MADPLLQGLAARARAARLARGWTVRELAERSGLSPRYLVHLESGNGNISVKRLADVARALDTTVAQLLAETDAPAAPAIALLGLRGAGKTTVGRRLARRLRLPFLELDRRIEQAADLSLSELFSLHGEEYYRRLERDVLDQVLAERRELVMATGGGIVTSAETFARLRRSSLTVWLRATAEDHWKRVVSQGDRRPMANHPEAMAELRARLAAREPLYALADHTIDTATLSVSQVVEAIARLVAANSPDLK